MLAAASREVGGVQIQNRGTIGGNVANASPAGDTLPVLLAADAVVVLRSASGTRRMPMTSFYTGYRQSVARPDELIVASRFPRYAAGNGFARSARARPRPSRRSWSPESGRGGADARPRLAMGSVAPTARRLMQTEQALGSGASLAEAQAILQREIAPIDDLRSTAEYRRQVAANLLGQFPCK